MRIEEIMTTDLATCTSESSLTDCAAMMKKFDCGMIPVVEGNGRKMPIGALTDRDIVCRTLAEGINPMDCNAGDVMSQNPITIDHNEDHKKAVELMENNQVRRLIVVNENGECVGVVSQADLAREVSEEEVAEVVQRVSEPSDESRLGG